MAGLGSFIQGAMQGYSYGTEVKDKKRRDKIQDQQLEREAERHDWARDAHGWAGENSKLNRQISQHNLSTSQKAAARAEEERQMRIRIHAEEKEAWEKGGKEGPEPTAPKDTAPAAPTEGEGRSVIRDSDGPAEGTVSTQGPEAAEPTAESLEAVRGAGTSAGQTPETLQPAAMRPPEGRAPQDGQPQGVDYQPDAMQGGNTPAGRSIMGATYQPDQMQAPDPYSGAAAYPSRVFEGQPAMPLAPNAPQAPQVGMVPQGANPQIDEAQRAYGAQPVGRFQSENHALQAQQAQHDMAQQAQGRGVMRQSMMDQHDPRMVPPQQDMSPSGRRAGGMPMQGAQDMGADYGAGQRAPSQPTQGPPQVQGPPVAPEGRDMRPPHEQLGIDQYAAGMPRPEQGPPVAPAEAAPQQGRSIRDVNPDASAFVQDVQEFMRNGDIEGARMAIANGLTGTAPASRALAGLGDYFSKTPEEGKKAKATRDKRTKAMEWFRGYEAKGFFAEQPDLLAEAAKDPVAFHALVEEGKASNAPPDAAAAAGSVQGPPERAVQGPPAAGAAPTDVGAANQPPSVDAAVTAVKDTMTEGQKSRGVQSVTPQQEKRAAASFADHWKEHGIPRVVDGYRSMGENEKAQAFEAYAESAQVKKQMDSFSKALFALTVGNGERFLDHVNDTYSAIDDGYDMVRDKSGIVKDEDGNIAGAQITFIDHESGEEFVKTYKSQQELLDTGLFLLGGENTFEKMWELNEKAIALQQGGGKGTMTQKDRQTAILAEAGRLRKEVDKYSGEEPPTEEELLRQAAANLGLAGYYSIGGQPPTAPAEDWSG